MTIHNFPVNQNVIWIEEWGPVNIQHEFYIEKVVRKEIILKMIEYFG